MKCKHFAVWKIYNAQMRLLGGLPNNRISKLGETNTFTKVVTQMVSFVWQLGSDPVVEHGDVPDEEDRQMSAASEFSLQSSVIWQVFTHTNKKLVFTNGLQGDPCSPLIFLAMDISLILIYHSSMERTKTLCR